MNAGMLYSLWKFLEHGASYRLTSAKVLAKNHLGIMPVFKERGRGFHIERNGNMLEYMAIGRFITISCGF